MVAPAFRYALDMASISNKLILLLGSASFAGFAVGTPATAAEDLLRRQQEFMTPSVTYCAETLPQMRGALLAGNERFRGIAEEATRPLRQRMGAALAEPAPQMPPELDPARSMLEHGKRQGALTFCPQLLQTLESVSVQALQQAVENAFARMQERASELKSTGSVSPPVMNDGGPQAPSYAQRIRAAIVPYVVLAEPIEGNPTAQVKVTTRPNGEVVDAEVVESSGYPTWDTSVRRAVLKAGRIPLDVDGKVPPVLIISFKPER